MVRLIGIAERMRTDLKNNFIPWRLKNLVPLRTYKNM